VSGKPAYLASLPGAGATAAGLRAHDDAFFGCPLQALSDWLIEVLVYFVRQVTLWCTVSKQEYAVLR
jgi:hypothetical protein